MRSLRNIKARIAVKKGVHENKIMYIDIGKIYIPIFATVKLMTPAHVRMNNNHLKCLGISLIGFFFLIMTPIDAQTKIVKYLKPDHSIRLTPSLICASLAMVVVIAFVRAAPLTYKMLILKLQFG